MNLQQQIDYMAAAANPFPLTASFEEMQGGGYKCKMCGEKCADQGKATDHLLQKHREMEARDFSPARRKKLAKSGAAMPGGGFPIVNRSDLANAKRAIGRAKNPAAARRHINERAKALGAKPIGEMESEQFAPSDRLEMPRKAGQDTKTQDPRYTGGAPQLSAEKVCGCKACSEKRRMEALGIKLKRPSGGGCGSHGFHRGAGYESKARGMGHTLPLSAAAERVIIVRQRPGGPRKLVNSGYKGEQFL